MALGPDEWKETMEHLDRINLVLEEEEEEEEDYCKYKDCKDMNCMEE